MLVIRGGRIRDLPGVRCIRSSAGALGTRLGVEGRKQSRSRYAQKSSK